jgi:hypothetical protein
MLSKLQLQAYQDLEKALLELQKLLYASNPERTSLQKNFQIVQQIFQQQVMILTDDELDPAIAQRWQSIQIEIHRSLRLLEMDMMFLHSSKQAATVEARLNTLRDRIQKIIGYCQVMLQESE